MNHGTGKPPLDAYDRKILACLQDDATTPVAGIAERVNLSHNACWRRIKRLEEAGFILRRVALLNAAALGLDMTVFVSIRASEHSGEWLNHLKAVVRDIPEVVEFYRMTGEVDYLLKVRVASIAAYDAVYQRLIREVRLNDVSSAFSMEEIKYSTALPLD